MIPSSTKTKHSGLSSTYFANIAIANINVNKNIYFFIAFLLSIIDGNRVGTAGVYNYTIDSGSWYNSPRPTNAR